MQITSSLKASPKLRRIDFASKVLFPWSISGGRLLQQFFAVPLSYFISELLDPNETDYNNKRPLCSVELIGLCDQTVGW